MSIGMSSKKVITFRASLSGPRRRGPHCEDERLRVEAFLWVLRTGAGWRFLPKNFGSWSTVYSCFRAWSASGLWGSVLEALSEDADPEFLMLDSTAVYLRHNGTTERQTKQRG